MTLRSSLSRMHGTSPLDQDGVRRMAAAIWHRKGVALIDLNEVKNEIQRAVIQQVAERLYGKRRES